ncbi:MAG TPA: ABC transporter substrate-binding protein [Spirochaetales bacterium]|nr:ABC transporter substrate-binding protein [Spirochaetales bacterium]
MGKHDSLRARVFPGPRQTCRGCGLLLVATLGIAACVREPILVGVPVGLTGLGARVGVMGRNGIELAAEEINASGGVRGRPLELVVADDGDSPETALEADRFLADSGVVCLVGHMSSKTGVLTAAFATERELPLLSPTVSAPEHSGKDDYFFRIVASSDLQGRDLAAYALSRGARKAALAWELTNASYSIPMKERFAETFLAGGGEITGGIGFPTGADTDYASIARTLLEGGPDAILVSASSWDVANVCQNFALLGARPLVLLPLWGRTDDLITLGGASVEGVVAISGIDPDDPSENNLAFRSAYLARYGEEADFGADYGYEAMRIMAQALERARSLAGPDIKQALLSLEEPFRLQGELRLDAFGDCDRPYGLSVIRDGAFETLR